VGVGVGLDVTSLVRAPGAAGPVYAGLQEDMLWESVEAGAALQQQHWRLGPGGLSSRGSTTSCTVAAS
jgi:hypothetical protein